MTQCTACGTENADGMRFCVKCGAAMAAAPDPGSWQAPSGNLYDTPTPSGGLNQPGSYAPPPVVHTGYGGLVTSAGIGGYPFAEWIDRVLAALIDGGISVAVMIVLYIIMGIVGGGLMAIGGGLGDDAGGALGALGSLSCCFGFLLAAVSVFAVGIYNKVFLVSKRGFSIGQGIMKLKVVDANGNIPQMGTLVLRLLVQVALGFIPFIGIFLGLANALWPLWDEKKQTLHDKAVGTFVLKTG
jgi:uncharacterized RDD family membrane protein YckC